MIRPARNYEAWRLPAAAYPHHGTITEQILFLCRYGVLAPSVHNTQPWHFQVAGNRLWLNLDPDRLLEAGDPTGREAWLSLGACLENMAVAGRHFGLAATVARVGAADRGVVITWQETTPQPDVELLEAIIRRTSNRAPYSKRTPSPARLQQIEQSYHHPDILLMVKANRSFIRQLAELTSRGIGMALSNPRFKRELAQLLRPSWTRQTTGFAPQPGAISSALEAGRTRWLAVARRQAAKEHAAVLASAAAVVVFSRGDTPPYWLEAGRAYQHSALEATRLGLSTSTSAAVVEAADYHLDIEAACHTTFRLQTVMRLGYGPHQPHAPRRPLVDAVE